MQYKIDWITIPSYEVAGGIPEMNMFGIRIQNLWSEFRYLFNPRKALKLNIQNCTFVGLNYQGTFISNAESFDSTSSYGTLKRMMDGYNLDYFKSNPFSHLCMETREDCFDINIENNFFNKFGYISEISEITGRYRSTPHIQSKLIHLAQNNFGTSKVLLKFNFAKNLITNHERGFTNNCKSTCPILVPLVSKIQGFFIITYI